MNLVQEKMTEILEDGGMNDKHKKRELIKILKEACPKTKNSKEFAKEKLEDWIENYCDRQEPEDTSLLSEKKRVLKIIKLREERELFLKNLWDEEKESITNED